MAETPLVSVIIATYNQEDIVGRAIESALRQDTSFPYEIVVGEDCSTDGTAEVVDGYARRFPGRVRALHNPENMFIQRNMASMMKATQARYIAWLDADDYWTHPGKLQKQVAFLEENPSYIASCHNVRNVALDGALVDACYPGVPAGTKTIENLIVEDFVATPSIVFRNALTGRIPDWYFTGTLTDWPLWLILAQDGLFMHSDDVMADYTLHPKSTWSSRGRIYQCGVEIEFYRRCRTFLPARYGRLVRSCEGVRHERLSRACMAADDWPAARRAALQAATTPDWRDNLKDKCRVVLDAYAPGPMKAFRYARGIR